MREKGDIIQSSSNTIEKYMQTKNRIMITRAYDEHKLKRRKHIVVIL
jgi:hypothetical protein